MIRVVSVLVTLLLGATAWARPVILQSTETIPSPDPTYTYFGYGLAIDGDWAIIIGEKWQEPERRILRHHADGVPVSPGEFALGISAQAG